MKLYRAMNESEFQETLRSQSPAFLKRYKFFSPTLEFIQSRVQNSTFAHSNQSPQKYARVVEFTIHPDDVSKFTQLNKKEWMMDRRVSHQVRWSVKSL